LKIGHFFIVAFLISVGIICFGEAGLLSAYRMSQEKAMLEARINRLEKDNEVLRSEIDSIQKNPRYLEHTIRKSLSLVAADEILYEFQ
jgi:cell division protein FtsB